MRRRNLMLSLLVLCLAGLVGMTACGGGGNSGGGGGGGNTPTGVTIYPGGNGATVSMAAGTTGNFTAYVADTATNVNWTASGGTITGSGSPNAVFTAPTSAGTVTITAVDTSSANLGGSVTVNVTAAPAGGVLVVPGATQVAAGSTTAFSATQNGTAITAAVWQVNGAQGGDTVHGTIDANGNYTAPLTPPPGGATTITACQDAGCTTTATASVTVVFSNASLNGPYAFSYTGQDPNGFVTVAGSFVANGSSGSITSGEEDYYDGTTNAGGANFGGSFSIGPDGRGAISITSNAPDSGGELQFALTNSAQGKAAAHGIVIRLDTLATASGTIDAQDPNALSQGATAFSGNYVFGLSGIDLFGNPLQVAGRFFSDGIGAFLTNTCEQDINDNGTVLTTADVSLQGNFSPDQSSSTAGRGTLSFNSTNSIFIGQAGGTSVTTTFVYYMVDQKHIKLVETDNNFITAGDIFQETGGNGPFYASVIAKGNFAFTMGGVDITRGGIPFASGGVFAASGATGTASSGSITGGVYDSNDNGTIRSDLTISSGSYTGDSSNFGRFNFALSISGGSNLTFIGYPGTYNGPNGPVNVIEFVDETGSPTTNGTANFVDGGLAYEQTAANTPNGSYALNMSGVATCQGCSEQDIEGQVTTGANGALNGNLDINNVANAGGTISTSVPLSSSSVTTVGTGGRGTPMTIHTQNGINFTENYYVVDDNTTLLLETDSSRVTTGVILKQY